MVYDTGISNIIFYKSDLYIVDTINFTVSNIELEKLRETNLKKFLLIYIQYLIII